MSPVRLACSLCPLTATSEGCYGIVVCGSSAEEASPASSSGCWRPDLAGPFLFIFRADEGCRSARLSIKLFVVSTWSFARGLFSSPDSCIRQELKSVLRACRVPPPVDLRGLPFFPGPRASRGPLKYHCSTPRTQVPYLSPRS
jgi:hypothetical protein